MNWLNQNLNTSVVLKCWIETKKQVSHHKNVRRLDYMSTKYGPASYVVYQNGALQICNVVERFSSTLESNLLVQLNEAIQKQEKRWHMASIISSPEWIPVKASDEDSSQLKTCHGYGNECTFIKFFQLKAPAIVNSNNLKYLPEEHFRQNSLWIKVIICWLSNSTAYLFAVNTNIPPVWSNTSLALWLCTYLSVSTQQREEKIRWNSLCFTLLMVINGIQPAWRTLSAENCWIICFLSPRFPAHRAEASLSQARCVCGTKYIRGGCTVWVIRFKWTSSVCVCVYLPA